MELVFDLCLQDLNKVTVSGTAASRSITISLTRGATRIGGAEDGLVRSDPLQMQRWRKSQERGSAEDPERRHSSFPFVSFPLFPALDVLFNGAFTDKP